MDEAQKTRKTQKTQDTQDTQAAQATQPAQPAQDTQVTQDTQLTQKQKTIRRMTLFIAMLAAFLFPFAGSSLSISIPFIAEDFQTPAASLSWIMSALMLTNVALNVPFGKFADLWERRKVFNLGTIIFAVASLLGAFAPSFGILIGIRVLQGIGAAMFISTNFAILLDVFPGRERGRVLGLTVMCTYIGLAIGPVIGGFITHYLSWRAIFVVTSAVALIVFIVAMTSASKLPKAKDVSAKSVSINPVSNILYIAAMLMFMYGFTVFGQHLYSYFFLAIGIILLVIFAWHELRTTTPIIEVRLFKGNPNFIFSNLAALLNYAATGTISYVMTIYLVVVRGFQPDVAGLLLIIQPALMAIFSPIMGKLSDKRSPFIISSVGMAICALCQLLFVFLSETTSLIYVGLVLAIIGFGFGVFSSPNTNAILSSVSQKDSGVANSILATMRIIGQLSSMAIITIVMYFTIGNALISEAGTAGIMRTLHTTFIVFAILCAVGVLLSLGRKRAR